MGGADAGGLAVDDRTPGAGAGREGARQVRSLSSESRRRDELAWLCVGTGAGRLSAWPAGAARSDKTHSFGELAPGGPPATQLQARLPTVFCCIWRQVAALAATDETLACGPRYCGLMACICFAPDDGMWIQSKRHHASGQMSELGFLCLEKHDERHHLTPIR